MEPSSLADVSSTPPVVDAVDVAPHPAADANPPLLNGPTDEAQIGLLNHICQSFQITVKNNERNLKNPSQLVYDDTLHCQPSKPVAIYLGEKLYFDQPPVITAYVKFADDKRKNNIVAVCAKHPRKEGFGSSILYSDNHILGFRNDEFTQISCIDFAYPDDDVPAISLSFICSSSCFGRALFDLHVDLNLADGTTVCRQMKVKVCANPSRDSGHQETFMKSILEQKNPGQSRQRKSTASSSGPLAKRQLVEEEDNDDEKVAPLTRNGVYTLNVFGLDAYKSLLQQYNMQQVNDKYMLKKISSAQNPLFNSQLAPNSAVDSWLELNNMKKHQHRFATRKIKTMAQLSGKYNSYFFENMGIPRSEAESLHLSFIFWQTGYLNTELNKNSGGELND